MAMLILLATSAAWADSPHYCGTTQWASYIAEAATQFNLPPRWLHAVIRAESAGCDRMEGVPTTSGAGAMGLMQVMPPVWRMERKRLGLGDDPYQPRDNILAGAAYLRELYDRYGWPAALAAYHAGPARYEDSLSAGRPLPQATLDYVAHIERSLGDSSLEERLGGVTPRKSVAADRSVFVSRKSAEPAEHRQSVSSPHDGVFVRLRHAGLRTTEKHSEAEHVQSP